MTKKEVIKIAKKYWNCDFNIELFKDRVILRNSLHFEMDLKYGSLAVKRSIYRFIVAMLKNFDFSYTIEVYSWETLLETEKLYLQDDY